MLTCHKMDFYQKDKLQDELIMNLLVFVVCAKGCLELLFKTCNLCDYSFSLRFYVLKMSKEFGETTI